jgi:ABC-2 type transport system permease protein
VTGFAWRLRAIAWKELLEALRDRRTIGLMALSAMLLPVLGLFVSGLRGAQQAPIAIVVCDTGPEAEVLSSLLARAYSERRGFVVSVVEGCKLSGNYVFAIVIPWGLTENATSIDRPVVVKYVRVVGSVAANEAESIADSVLAEYSKTLARRRVSLLAQLADVNITDPDNVLYPVRVKVETVTAGGAPAQPGLEERVTMARFLSFAVFFVLNPAAVAVVDALVGERERGTAEMLAASPLRPRELVLGKMVGGLILALMAAAIDATGVLAYLVLVSGQGVKGLGPDLALVHAVQTLLAVMVTAALSVPVALRAPTPRSATMGALLVTGAATAIFFASFFVDFDQLPPALQLALYLIPYSHIAMAIYSYAVGEAARTLLHTCVTIAAAAVSIALAARLYRAEIFVRQV